MQAAQEGACRADPPRRVQIHHGVRTFKPNVESLVVVAVGDPSVTREQADLLLPPLALRWRNPAGLPEVDVEVNDRQMGPCRQRARERALAGPRHPSHDDTAAYS